MAAGPAQTDSWHCHIHSSLVKLTQNSLNGQHMPLYDLTTVITVFPLQFQESFYGWNTNLLRSDSAQIKMRLWKGDRLVYSQFCAIMANFTPHDCNKYLPFHLFNVSLIQPALGLISAAIHQRY